MARSHVLAHGAAALSAPRVVPAVIRVISRVVTRSVQASNASAPRDAAVGEVGAMSEGRYAAPTADNRTCAVRVRMVVLQLAYAGPAA